MFVVFTVILLAIFRVKRVLPANKHECYFEQKTTNKNKTDLNLVF
jgi:hypothetical protein